MAKEKKKRIESTVKCTMPGIIIKIKVKVGEKVKEGDVIALLESMKMENDIKSPIAGEVKKIYVNEDDTVSPDDILMVIKS